MWIQTDRLNIRDLKTADGIIFSGMASDGSLTEIWTDTGHPGWMEVGWRRPDGLQPSMTLREIIWLILWN